jgi:hypothetical protein
MTPGAPLVRLCPEGCPRQRAARKTSPEGRRVARRPGAGHLVLTRLEKEHRERTAMP